MTTAILDTNVLVQYYIGSSRSASVRTVEAFYQGRYRHAYSLATLEECFEVFMLPTMRARHGLTDVEILDFLASIFLPGNMYPGSAKISAQTTRDVTDIPLLAVAVESGAEYLVTNDHRHLLRLKQFSETKIVTPGKFLRLLK